MAPSLAAMSRTARSAVVHGIHPLRGYPVTWHLTPMASPRTGPHEFLVERADGHIDDDAVWAFAEKDATVMSSSEAADLVRRVSRL